MVKSIKELRRICQATKKDKDPLYVSLVLRRFSIYLTWLLLHLPISGNQVTVLFLLYGAANAFIFAIPSPWAFLVGSLLLNGWFLLDCSDGEIARYRKQSSLTGLYLDYLAHYIVHPLMYLCLSWGLFLIFYERYILLLGMAAAFSEIYRELTTDCLYKAVCSKWGGVVEEVSSAVTNPKGSFLGRIVKFLNRYVYYAFFTFPQAIATLILISVINLYWPASSVFGLKMNLFVVFLMIQTFYRLPITLYAFYNNAVNRSSERLYLRMREGLKQNGNDQ